MKYIKSIKLLSFIILVVCCYSCKEQRPNNRFVINEVMLENSSNILDDYGMHNAWIELYNKTYSSVDLAGYHLKAKSSTGDTLDYIIPKGDVKTIIKPRQHALFWADGFPKRGTFHTSLTLDPSSSVWIGLYDSGNVLIDDVELPIGKIAANQSWARQEDGSSTWELKDDSSANYITPDTNNKVLDTIGKMMKFKVEDSAGVGMAITAMLVVFTALLTLYLSFKYIGNISICMSKRNQAKKESSTCISAEKENTLNGSHKGDEDDVYAAIAMALYEMNAEVHDYEDMVLTIRRTESNKSAWNSKGFAMRETPIRK